MPSASESGRLRLRILHFSGGKGHVVPGIRRKQRSHLGHGKNGQRAHQDHRAARAHLYRMLRAQSRVVPEVAVKIRRQRLRVAPEKQPEPYQS